MRAERDKKSGKERDEDDHSFKIRLDTLVKHVQINIVSFLCRKEVRI